MDDIDPDALDAKVETERQWLVSTLRRIADRLEALSVEDVIEPLALLSEPAAALIHRAEAVLRVPLGSPPPRPA
jgi:hydroxypyruvate isomerase